MSKCRSCGAEITWVSTANGKKMPVDSKPSPNGNIMIGDGNKACVLSGLELEHYRAGADVTDDHLYISHFVTCPNSGFYRKPKEST